MSAYTIYLLRYLTSRPKLSDYKWCIVTSNYLHSGQKHLVPGLGRTLCLFTGKQEKPMFLANAA